MTCLRTVPEIDQAMGVIAHYYEQYTYHSILAQ